MYACKKRNCKNERETIYKDGKPQYYCYGYIDSMTDEPLEECVNCKKWVDGEQCEKDYEEEIARRKEEAEAKLKELENV